MRTTTLMAALALFIACEQAQKLPLPLDGGTDAGVITDAGATDAGVITDAGQPDAGLFDAGLPPSGCEFKRVAHGADCAADCDAHLLLPANDYYCTAQCTGPADCVGTVPMTCADFIGGACMPSCATDLECRTMGLAYCNLDGGACDSLLPCTTTTECTAHGFTMCDTSSGYCF